MKTWILIYMAIVILLWFLSVLRRKPSQKKGCIDAVIPACNEGPCPAQSPNNLLHNPYFRRVICINDGSMDDTKVVMVEVKYKWGDRFVVVTQKDTGKGGVLMDGPNYATCGQVLLSDVDTYVPPDQDRMGYMLAEIECGADTVGGIPFTALKGAGLLPHICATVKLPMIVMRRTLRQFLGGVPSIISGACGTFRTDVLRKFGFSDRTKVEDLDLTWILVVNGYRIRQTNHHTVYPQECSSPREEWRRWRHRIMGYAVRMCLHRRLLFNRFGIFSISSMLLVVLYGVGICLTIWFNEFIITELHGAVLVMSPLIWAGVVRAIGAPSTQFYRCWLLVPLAPLSAVYVLLAYAIWIIYGLIAFFTGCEPQRDKPARYSTLVKMSAAYFHPSITGTEELSEVQC